VSSLCSAVLSYGHGQAETLLSPEKEGPSGGVGYGAAASGRPDVGAPADGSSGAVARVTVNAAPPPGAFPASTEP
jgi:hypothetical protein